ncbi:hypothetical protein NFC81_08635 [Salinispirillum sp. LH 10-3-1]|uniref:Uncharacterized protein n=1 Tax=Salinispirillum sp. LH 10-3-1 TaxID=2952525 RepID=A0AB38YBQ9_9GAMM
MPFFSRVLLAVPIILAITVQASIATESEISAFGTLNELAVRDENERELVSNVLFVGSGVSAAVAVGMHLDGEYEIASLLSVTSALALGGGVLARNYESSTERALARVLLLEDPLEREQRSRDALFQLASEQRRSRITSGIFNVSVASYYLFLDDGESATFNGVVSLAAGVAYFALQSPAERAVKRLQGDRNEHAFLNKLDWHVAIAGGQDQLLSFGVSF